jgi:hypothetical protein
MTAASTATNPDRAFTDDMGALADAVSPVAGNGPLVYIASPGRALKIRLRMMREDPKVIVLASNAVINDLLCVAPAALVSVAGDQPELEASEGAVLQMDTTPGDPQMGRTYSMFQMDSIALKTRWPVTWSLRDPRGFAWTTPAALPNGW